MVWAALRLVVPEAAGKTVCKPPLLPPPLLPVSAGVADVAAAVPAAVGAAVEAAAVAVCRVVCFAVALVVLVVFDLDLDLPASTPAAIVKATRASLENNMLMSKSFKMKVIIGPATVSFWKVRDKKIGLNDCGVVCAEERSGSLNVMFDCTWVSASIWQTRYINTTNGSPEIGED